MLVFVGAHKMKGFPDYPFSYAETVASTTVHTGDAQLGVLWRTLSAVAARVLPALGGVVRWER